MVLDNASEVEKSARITPVSFRFQKRKEPVAWIGGRRSALRRRPTVGSAIDLKNCPGKLAERIAEAKCAAGLNDTAGIGPRVGFSA